MTNYVTTATTIFENNQAVGWWTDKNTGESLVGKRPLGMISALIHSEFSEAMEGLRKDLNDDHLPERKMVEVEIADAAIRAYDFLGSEISLSPTMVDDRVLETATDYVKTTLEELKPETPVDYIAAMHVLTSDGYASCALCFPEYPEAGNSAFAERCLAIIIGCETFSEEFGYDLQGAMKDKLAYNLNRADHKLENRNKEGGKQF